MWCTRFTFAQFAPLPIPIQPEPSDYPKIFIYDLPARFSAYGTALYGMNSDFSRLDGFSWLNAFYRSRHRTVPPILWSAVLHPPFFQSLCECMVAGLRLLMRVRVLKCAELSVTDPSALQADPEKADFFVLPVWGGPSVRLVTADA